MHHFTIIQYSILIMTFMLSIQTSKSQDVHSSDIKLLLGKDVDLFIINHENIWAKDTLKDNLTNLKEKYPNISCMDIDANSFDTTSFIASVQNQTEEARYILEIKNIRDIKVYKSSSKHTYSYYYRDDSLRSLLNKIFSIIHTEKLIQEKLHNTKHLKTAIKLGMPTLVKKISVNLGKSDDEITSFIKSSNKYEKNIYRKKPDRFQASSADKTTLKYKSFIDRYKEDNPFEYGQSRIVKTKMEYTTISTRFKNVFIEKQGKHEIIYKKLKPYYGITVNPLGFNTLILDYTGCIHNLFESGCYVNGDKVGYWSETLYYLKGDHSEDGEEYYSEETTISFSSGFSSRCSHCYVLEKNYDSSEPTIEDMKFGNKSIIEQNVSPIVVRYDLPDRSLKQHVLENNDRIILFTELEHDSSNITSYQVSVHNKRTHKLKGKTHRFCGVDPLSTNTVTYSELGDDSIPMGYVYNIITHKGNSEKIKSYEVSSSIGILLIEHGVIDQDSLNIADMPESLKSIDKILSRIKNPHYYPDRFFNVIGLSNANVKNNKLHGSFTAKSMRDLYSYRAVYKKGVVAKYPKGDWSWNANANPQGIPWICDKLPYSSILISWNKIHRKLKKKLMVKGDFELGATFIEGYLQ